MKTDNNYTRFQVMKYVNKYTVKIKGTVILLLIISILSVFVPVTNPRFFQILIDDVMVKGEYNKFYIIIVGLLSIYFVRLILDGFNLFLSNKILNEFIYNLRIDIWSKYINFSNKFIDKSTAELKMRIIDDVDHLSNFIKNQIVEFFSSIFLAVLALTLSFLIDIKLTLICILLIPIVFTINNYIGHLTKKINEKIRKVNEEYYNFEHSSLINWKEIKANTLEEEKLNAFASFRKRLAKLGYTSIRYWFYTETINDFKANYLSKAMIYCLGVYLVVYNKMSLGNLILFAEYYSLLFTALDTIQTKNVQLKTLSPYYKRIFETLDVSNDRLCDNQIISLNNIKVNDVSLILNDKTILSNINVHFNLGDRIAVYGKSGAGKSMLIKTILGQIDINEGEILINDKALSSIDKISFYNKVIAVMQDSFLFNMSIRENLMLVNNNLNDYEIEEACKKANILDFINTLPLGLETLIGEGGVKLSGGQKQRLAIARALLKYEVSNGPYLIILDEITSSLDTLSENIIRSSINEFNKEDIVISISHRPTMLEDSKTKINIDEGKIISVG